MASFYQWETKGFNLIIQGVDNPLDKDFTLIQSVDSGIILTSPNGTKYKLGVDNSGNLTTTAV